MKYDGDEHRTPSGYITPNVGYRLSARFSSLCRSGCERSEFPDGSQFPWSYDEFARRYGRQTLEGEVTALAPASDQQVNQISGSSVQIVDEGDRNQRQTKLADCDSRYSRIRFG